MESVGVEEENVKSNWYSFVHFQDASVECIQT